MRTILKVLIVSHIMTFRSAINSSFRITLLSFIGMGLGYIFRVLLAHNLSVAEYGIFYGVLSFFLLISIFIDLGLTQALSRSLVKLFSKKDYSGAKNLIFTAAVAQLCASLVIATFLWAGYTYLGLFAKYDFVSLSIPLILMIVWLVTFPIDVLLKSIYLGSNKTVPYALSDPFKTLFSLIVVLFCFFIGLRFLAPFIAYALINIALLIAFLPFTIPIWKKLKTKAAGLRFVSFRSLFHSSFLIAISNFSWSIMTYTDTILLFYFRSPIEVGLYQAAVPISMILAAVATSVSIAIYPIIVKLISEKKANQATQLISLFNKYLFMMTILLSLIFIIFPETILSMLFGAKFTLAALALQILSFGAIFLSLGVLNNSILLASGYDRLCAKIAFYLSALNLALNLFLIPAFGFIGSAVSTTICVIIFGLATLYQVHKIYSVKLPYGKLIGSFVCGLGVIFVIGFLKSLVSISIWIKLPLFAILAFASYALLLISTGLISLVEIRRLLRNIMP